MAAGPSRPGIYVNLLRMINDSRPPISATSPKESTINKKRKRAYTAQLKVVDEVYARTAFPSMEEHIAITLDMSVRSVHLWQSFLFTYLNRW